MRLRYILKASVHSIKHRKSAFLISVFSISVSFMMLCAIGNISFGIAAATVNRSLTFPLVVGPVGSSDTSLVMSSVFNVDKPDGTLDYGIYEELSADKRVRSAFPVIRSDSYQGVPITGVNSAYINEISKGFSSLVQNSKADDIFGEGALHCAVIGSKIAARHELEVGDGFFGSHGHVGDEDAHEHSSFAYSVCGILKPTNSVEDFSIFVDLRSAWAIHHAHHHHDYEGEHEHDGELEHEGEHEHEGKITAVLVKTVNPAATAALEREYSENGRTNAANVAKTVRQLVQYMNKAETAAGFFSYGTLVLVMLMVFVTILMAVNERKKEMALMRTIGIGRFPIAMMIVCESLFTALCGIIAGSAAGHAVLALLKPRIDVALGISLEPFYFTAVELNGIVVTAVTALLISFAALVKIYRMNLTEEISRD